MSGSVAATIQGEAGSNPANQFAVASVIYNRVQAGNFPGGTNAYAVVNAPSQFTGSATPNSTAQQFADAIENGTLGQYGTTGNAVNFQTAGSATTLGSNSPGVVNIGGNNFSDNFGPPTSNFVPPSYGGVSGAPSGDPNISITEATPNDPGGGDYGGDGTTAGSTPSIGTGPGQINPYLIDPNTGQPYGAGQGGIPSTVDPGSINPQTGQPVGAGTGLTQIGQFLGNWFVRLGLIAVGVVLIAAAAANLAKEHGVIPGEA